jgi:hypothetical protein
VRLATIVAVPILLCVGTEAKAQIAGALDFGGGLGQSAPGAWGRESLIAPALRFSNRHGYLYLDGEIAERGGETSLRRHRTEWAVSTPAWNAFRLTAAADYAHDRLAPAPYQTSLNVTSALSARWGASGIRTSVSRGHGSGTRLDLGVWRAIGNAVFSLSSGGQFIGTPTLSVTNRTITFRDSTFNDTTGGWNYFNRQRTLSDSATVSRLQQWSQLEGRVDWAMRRLTLSVTMSGRAAVDSVPASFWGRVGATMQINPRVSLTAGAGMLPLPGPATARASRFATLGVRLSPAAILRAPLPHGVRTSATAFAVSPAAAGGYTVTIRAPSARLVEISGDFTNWSPVALRETAPSVWQVTIPMTPGTHRVNLRVDGDSWAAPPGLPAVNDEFNGRVGLLVIR